MARMEVLQRDSENLFAENNSVKETVMNLNSTISTNREEIEKLEGCVTTLTMDAEKASTKIQELETARDALDKALEESTQSLNVKTKELSEMQSQYNMEKRRFEDELCAFRKANEMLNEKLQKEEVETATLCLKIASLESTNLNLNSIISTNREEIEKLKACMSTLAMDARKSSAKVQELETARDALDKALEESMKSLSVRAKEPSEVQSQYNTEKKRLEDELCGFKKTYEMLNEKLKKENKGKETKLTEEEEGVRSSVQPRNNTQGEGISSAVFTPVTCTESICKYSVRAGKCCYRYGLDINKYNILAVAYDEHSVYLYSEMNKREEKLCKCEYGVYCLAWDQPGTLLAIGGLHNNNRNNTIQVWDIPNRKITKRLKIKDNGQSCYCLDWNGDTITAGTYQYIYQWNINDQDNDQDTQGNRALLPRETIQNEHGSCIMTVQWSSCKSKLATVTLYGDICIYDEKFELIHHRKAQYDRKYSILQWCPWDNKVIATCHDKGYLKIWKVRQGITLIKEVEHESNIVNIKWIPSKKAIITAHENNQLVLWEYPSLSIIRTINGHTQVATHLALNADKSAMVSKSSNEMIFWKPFDQF